MVPAVLLAADAFLPDSFDIPATVGDGVFTLYPSEAGFCVIMGAFGGLIIGLITEYYTSHSYKPVRELAHSCKTGAATNMIYGIAWIQVCHCSCGCLVGSGLRILHSL